MFGLQFLELRDRIERMEQFVNRALRGVRTGRRVNRHTDWGKKGRTQSREMDRRAYQMANGQLTQTYWPCLSRRTEAERTTATARQYVRGAIA